MDADRFDAMTKAVGIGASRRRVLVGLGGGVLAALMTGREATAAACAKAGQKLKRHKPCCGALTPDEDGCCARVLSERHHRVRWDVQG